MVIARKRPGKRLTLEEFLALRRVSRRVSSGMGNAPDGAR